MKKVRWYKIEVNVVLNFIGIRCFNNKVTSWTIILYIRNLKNRLRKGFQWYTNTYANFWLQCSSVLNCAPLTCLQYWFRDQGWDTIYTIHVSWTIHSDTTNHRIVVLEKILVRLKKKKGRPTGRRKRTDDGHQVMISKAHFNIRL